MSVESANQEEFEERELVVFDFDDTIVDCNSDTWIHQLASGGIPSSILWRPGQDYFKHVQTLLKYLHSQNINEHDLYACLEAMPVVPGIIDNLIKVLGQSPKKYEIVILSDANSYFIESFLKAHSVDHLVSSIITNKSKFSKDGLLEVEAYHDQDFCSLSPRNLCKAEALKDYLTKRLIEKNLVYPCINYIGDGVNDFCPSTKLSPRDRVFPRIGYGLDTVCQKLRQSVDPDLDLAPGTPIPRIQASIIPWSNGLEICDVILGKSSSHQAFVLHP